MVMDAQRWLDTPASNTGWVVIGNETAASTAKRFDSREHPTPANRPRLDIGFIPLLFMVTNTVPANAAVDVALNQSVITARRYGQWGLR